MSQCVFVHITSVVLSYLTCGWHCQVYHSWRKWSFFRMLNLLKTMLPSETLRTGQFEPTHFCATGMWSLNGSSVWLLLLDNQQLTDNYGKPVQQNARTWTRYAQCCSAIMHANQKSMGFPLETNIVCVTTCEIFDIKIFLIERLLARFAETLLFPNTLLVTSLNTLQLCILPAIGLAALLPQCHVVVAVQGEYNSSTILTNTGP